MLRNVLRYQIRVIDCCCIATFFVRTQHALCEPKKEDIDLNGLENGREIDVIKECCETGDLTQARKLHSYILQAGIKNNKIFSKYLIRMYARCGSIEDSLRTFDELENPENVSWTELISAYARTGHTQQAFVVFRRMHLVGTRPDRFIFLAILSVCQDHTHLNDGMFIHALVCESGYEADTVVATAVLAMYGRCGSPETSKRVFLALNERDAPSWNAMIRICIQNGKHHEAIQLFNQMQDRGVVPDTVDFATILEACKTASEVESVHAEVVKRDLESHPVVVAALVSAYGTSGDLQVAEQLVYTVHPADPVCWTKLISAYTQHGYYKEALQAFHEMQRRKLRPNSTTFAAVLDSCAGLGALVEGRLLHKQILEIDNTGLSLSFARPLINMYAMCGADLQEGVVIFGECVKRDLGLWNTLINAFSIHGDGLSVLKLFHLMQQDGVHPDQSTFNSVLSVCCYLGLVEPGYGFVTLMSRDHVLLPTLKNYVVMVELLGRGGDLDEAVKLINRTSYASSPILWAAFLNACRNWGDVHRGKLAAVRLFKLDEMNSAVYVVISRIYSREGRTDVCEKMYKLMESRGVKKLEPARSWTEINAVMHEFVTGDTSHPQAGEVHRALEKLEVVVDSAPRVDTSSLVMHDVEEEDEGSLWVHSERMAVVFGLMNTTGNETILVFKNRRVCGDCHSAIAVLSKLSKRKIIVRDTSRFHKFEDGSCSCGNYW